MNLILTTDDGLLIEQWEIEADFGNIEYPCARDDMAREILEKYRKGQEAEAQAKGEES